VALSFTHSASFGSFARVFLKSLYDLEGNTDPITAKSLLASTISNQLLQFRMLYLDYLKRNGFVGLNDFLYTFVGSLTKAQAEN